VPARRIALSPEAVLTQETPPKRGLSSCANLRTLRDEQRLDCLRMRPERLGHIANHELRSTRSSVRGFIAAIRAANSYSSLITRAFPKPWKSPAAEAPPSAGGGDKADARSTVPSSPHHSAAMLRGDDEPQTFTPPATATDRALRMTTDLMNGCQVIL
jgi:hypothetical protein